jgi:glucose-1-phosphate cytidylyltransferase
MIKNISTLILCGGKGSRLKKLGKKIPKTLVKVNNKHFIEYIINGFDKKYINKIIISGFYKFDILKKSLKTLKYKNIITFNDGNITILQRIKKTLMRERKDLLVCYGDELADIDFKKLINSHIKSKKLITISTIKLKSNFGFLKKNNDKYFFDEKPLIGYCNIGYMIFDYKNIMHIKNIKSISYYINKIGNLDQINRYTHEKNHITINTLEDLMIAQHKIKNL